MLLAVVTMLVTGVAAFAQPGPGGGRGFNLPFVMGTVQVVGDNGATLAVKATFGPQQEQTVMVALGQATKLWEVMDTDVATLKVGDTIGLDGAPLKVQARSVRVGDMQQLIAQVMGAPAGAPGGPGGGPGGRGFGGPMAMATVNSAVVSSVQPLIVDLNGLKIEVEVAKDAQVVKFQPLADATEIKPNAKIVAVGQRNDNNLAATVVLLDSTANGLNPMMMMGGMGGGRGGRGGPGGPPPGGAGAPPPPPPAPAPAANH